MSSSITQGRMMNRDLRIALVSCHAAVGDLEANVASMKRWLDRCREAKADIVCFPEANLSGYSLRPSPDSHSHHIDGMVLDTLRMEADRSGMILLAGWVAHNGSANPWISHAVVTPGEKTGIYRKTHLGPPERSAYTPGDDIPVFRVEAATIGIQLCYDAHFPELSTIMAKNGMDILFVPHASPHGTGEDKLASWKRHLVARAYDNAVFVMACNLSGTNDAGLDFPGAALAIDPSGQVIDCASPDPEGLLIVDVHASTLRAVRTHTMRYFVPNRRPDLYGDDLRHQVVELL